MPSKSLITVAVVGCSGCGKSSIIKKGCKAYAMSEPTTGIPPTDGKNQFRYTSRLGKINQGPNVTGSLRVLEADLSDFHLDDVSSRVWPDSAPRVDGVIVCYDSSSLSSFTHVERLVCGYNDLELPTVVMACKSDVTKEVDPHTAATMLRDHKVGLVEVSMYDDSGKDKMRRCFDWMIRAIYRDRSSVRVDSNSVYRNPASPDVLNTPNHPWDLSRPLLNSLPTDGIPMSTSSKSRASYFTNSPPIPHTPPRSPTRARSHNDLLSLVREREERGAGNQAFINDYNSRSSLPVTGINGDLTNRGADNLGSQSAPKRQDQRLSPWARLDDLFEKLLFSVVSDDDATFVSNFMLTYRRFATPRSVLLTMQKKMRQLDQETADPMFACLAQMNICRLLADWIRDYPYDFAVRGTAGALSALVKSIIAKTYLIHYGLEFLPFLETLPNLEDKDATWALKVDTLVEESDDSYSMLDEEEVRSASPAPESPVVSSASARPASPTQVSGTRERKHSLPLSRSTPKSATPHNGELEYSHKHIIRELQRISVELSSLNPMDVAQEITRIQKGLFLNIQPRHWLKHTLSSGPKDPETDTIARFNRFSNHIGDWVASLILCHDRPKTRAKQIERFVDIGVSLRVLNNYSGLRALVAGINAATYSGDLPMEIFKQRALEAYKSYQSWDLLFQAIRSHRAYRMALRNTKGACIPALEVHLLDLIRAHEGNPDYSSAHPSKIHWAKFNMIGRFIAGTVQAQEQCRQSPEYTFEEHPAINHLLVTAYIMDVEVSLFNGPMLS
ncbi:ras GEF [Thelephora ganbajun]|uniref:Ras GEF n=1 Tax=Thelephora ganbajun TaxID=370292 RepID=A0ACB6ZSD1_THEGA|nr:ras GEF [Thelephora ganbajun]